MSPRPQQKALTRKQQRQQRTGMDIVSMMQAYNLRDVKPITETQALAKTAFDSGKNIGLFGSAGTGKTFMALFLAWQWVRSSMEDSSRVYIIRSTVQTRNEGFQPGNHKEKIGMYESRYNAITNQLFQHDEGVDIYRHMKDRGRISFESTAFLRGEQIDNAAIIIDECQNMNYHELRTCITRIGDNCRLILAGDTKQDDLAISGANRKDVSGLAEMIHVLKRTKGFDDFVFTTKDVVRSGFVKDFLIAEEVWEEEKKTCQQ